MTEREALKLSQDALERSVATCFDQYAHQQVMSQPDHFINQTITAIKEALAQPEQEPMRLRRGDILRSIETDELCTVWSTSTTGKTLIKWGANDFCEYTAEQIGELFWIEKDPKELELAAEKADNYASFRAGYKFAIAHTTPQRTWVGLTDEERDDIVLNSTSKNKAVAKTEAKLKEKNA